MYNHIKHIGDISISWYFMSELLNHEVLNLESFRDSVGFDITYENPFCNGRKTLISMRLDKERVKKFFACKYPDKRASKCFPKEYYSFFNAVWLIENEDKYSFKGSNIQAGAYQLYVCLCLALDIIESGDSVRTYYGKEIEKDYFYNHYRSYF